MATEAVVAAVGWSTGPDAARVGREAAERAFQGLLSVHPQLAIVFGSPWFNQSQLLRGVQTIIGHVPVVGESTAGEICPAGPLTHSCVVLLMGGDTPFCGVGMSEAVDRLPREAGQQAAFAATQAFRGSPRTGCLLFGDGLVSTFAEVVRGIQEALGTRFLIVGGMAADELRFAQTYQYCNDLALSRGVVGVLLGGPLKIGVGIEHGFAPISKPRRITRAQANILYALDERPAADVYEEYFGADLVQRMRQEGLTRQTIAYPLGIHEEGVDRWLLRNVVSFEADGSLACSGEIREGAWLQLMIGSRGPALEAARRAATQAIRSLNRPACVIVFDSVSRRILLGPRMTAMEIAAIREVIGPTTPLAGCYTYGEQAPCGMTTAAEATAMQTGSVLVVALGT